MQQYTKNENPNINQCDILFLIYLNEKLSGISQFIQGDFSVLKIKEKYNLATWMLEVSSVAADPRLGIDLTEHYRS